MTLRNPPSVPSRVVAVATALQSAYAARWRMTKGTGDGVNEKHIDWSERFELGIPEVDLQHHYFADLINRLLEELGSADPTYQKRLIRELDAYARFHFISEENLMFRAGYPFLKAHARHHFALIDELNVRETRFAHGQIAATDITDFLIEWFLHHTAQEDRSFAEFLQAGGSGDTA